VPLPTVRWSAPSPSCVSAPSVGITFAPATISVVANVERDSRNRNLTIEADSSTYFRASTVQLDGDAEAVTQQFWFKSLPAGEYDIRGRLERSGGTWSRRRGT